MAAPGRTVPVSRGVLAGVSGLVLLATVVGFAPHRAPHSPEPLAGEQFAAGAVPPNQSGANLSVAPSSPWVKVGARATFASNWSAFGSGCSVAPVWFRWSLPAGPTAIELGPAAGANETATAWATETTTAEVVLRSSALLSCGPWSYTVDRVAYANVTVVPALGVGDLTLSPDPVTAYAPVNLTGTIVGGDPPFSANVTWGDGTSDLLRVSQPGNFSVAHSFPDGWYRPWVEVVDQRNQSARGTVAQLEDANDGPAIGLSPSSPVAEAGIPFEVNGTIVDAPPLSASLMACGSNVTLSLGPVPTQETCLPLTPGNLSLEFAAFPDAPGSLMVDGFLEPVSPRVNVSIVPVGPIEEGAPAFSRVVVTGGVPPLVVRWAFGGPRSPGPSGDHGDAGVPPVDRRTLLGDGSFLVTYDPNSSGPVWMAARVADAVGAGSGSLTYLPTIGPALQVVSQPTRPAGNSSAVCTVITNLAGGVPPLAWAISSARPFEGNASASGILSAGAVQLRWSGTLWAEGVVSVAVELVDGLGEVGVANDSCSLGTALSGRFDARWTPNGSGLSPTAFLELSGGAPPYSLQVAASNGTGWAGVENAPGNYTIALAVNTSGPVHLDLAAVDALGYVLHLATDLPAFPSVSAPRAPGPSTAVASSVTEVALAIVVAVLGLGAVAVAVRRRTRRRDNWVPPDPEETIRGILAPADGADRLTIELMAEETGIALEVVRSTIDRLVAAGRIRSETTPDGEEVLAWSELQDA